MTDLAVVTASICDVRSTWIRPESWALTHIADVLCRLILLGSGYFLRKTWDCTGDLSPLSQRLQPSLHHSVSPVTAQRAELDGSTHTQESNLGLFPLQHQPVKACISSRGRHGCLAASLCDCEFEFLGAHQASLMKPDWYMHIVSSGTLPAKFCDLLYKQAGAVDSKHFEISLLLLAGRDY